MSSEELKLCPFCGSPAKSDNGFSPAESITYAWCSNTECQLHSVDVGMTPADWNQRALPKVDPQPPTVSVTWHESPESVHRAMWEEVAVAEGMTYEQLIAESEGEGETETGETVAFTHEQELAGMRGQGCWAFVDRRTNTIHAWADEATPRELVLHMLAHEIGHITGEPHPDDMQEEMRAEQFGRVAKMAYGLLPVRAQLAAIQGGMGEVVEVVAYLLPDYAISRRLSTHSEMKIGKPLMTVAQHQRITAAMAAEVATWRSSAVMLEQANAGIAQLNGKLRAELAEVKGREAVAWHTEDHLDDKSATTYRKEVAERWRAKGWPVWPLYASPPASPDVDGLVKALTNLLSYAERQICTHEETHRGGAIWEICDMCGAKWADDEGGKPDFEWPAEIEAARGLLAASTGQEV